jgi:hypothetical protein
MAWRYGAVAVLGSMLLLACGESGRTEAAVAPGGGGASAGEGGAAGTDSVAEAGAGGSTADTAGAGGSGGSAGAASFPTSICDGSARIRLRVFAAPQLSHEPRGSFVRVENGYSRLHVDGLCHYWTSTWDGNDVLSRDREVREGQLTPDEAALLDSTFHLEDIGTELSDCPGAGAEDQTFRVMAAENAGVACQVGGPAFEKAWSTAASLASEWWMRGTPATGGVRISVIRSPAVGQQYPWTLATGLDGLQLAPDSETEEGVSTLLDDPTDVSKLRSLRASYLEERSKSPGLFKGGPQFVDQGISYYVYMRDATPYEDEHGLLPFWPPPPS